MPTPIPKGNVTTKLKAESLKKKTQTQNTKKTSFLIPILALQPYTSLALSQKALNFCRGT